MKRIVLWSSLGLVIVIATAGVLIARADVRHGWCGHGWGHHGWAGPGPLGYVAHQLDLNDSQRKQIRSMWDAEKPALTSLVQEFAAESKEMDSATANGNLDESKVQEIAGRQGATVAKLLVEKERFQSKVYSTVLTPEQRAKADELQARWHDRLSHIGHF